MMKILLFYIFIFFIEKQLFADPIISLPSTIATQTQSDKSSFTILPKIALSSTTPTLKPKEDHAIKNEIKKPIVEDAKTQLIVKKTEDKKDSLFKVETEKIKDILTPTQDLIFKEKEFLNGATQQHIDSNVFDRQVSGEFSVHASYLVVSNYIQRISEKYAIKFVPYGVKVNKKSFGKNNINILMEYLFPSLENEDAQLLWLKTVATIIDLFLDDRIDEKIIAIETIPLETFNHLNEKIITLNFATNLFKDILTKLTLNHQHKKADQSLDSFLKTKNTSFKFYSFDNPNELHSYYNNGFGVLFLIKDPKFKPEFQTFDKPTVSDSLKIENVNNINSIVIDKVSWKHHHKKHHKNILAKEILSKKYSEILNLDKNKLRKITDSGGAFYSDITSDDFTNGLFNFNINKNAIHYGYAAVCYTMKKALFDHENLMTLYNVNHYFDAPFLKNGINDSFCDMQYLFPINGSLEDQIAWLKATLVIINMFFESKNSIDNRSYYVKALDSIAIQTIPLNVFTFLKKEIAKNISTPLETTFNGTTYKSQLAKMLDTYEKILKRFQKNEKTADLAIEIDAGLKRTFFKFYDFNSEYDEVIASKAFEKNNYGVLFLIRSDDPIYSTDSSDQSNLHSDSIFSESEKTFKIINPPISDPLYQETRTELLKKPLFSDIESGKFNVTKTSYNAIHSAYSAASYFFQSILSNEKNSFLKHYYIFRNFLDKFSNNGINFANENMLYLYPALGSLKDKIDWLKITAVIISMFIDKKNSFDGKSFYSQINDFIVIETMPLETFYYLKHIINEEAILSQNSSGTIYTHILKKPLEIYESILKKLKLNSKDHTKEESLNIYLSKKGINFIFYGLSIDFDTINIEKSYLFNPYGVIFLIQDSISIDATS